MNDSAVRTLAGAPTPQSTISMSNLYGKSNRVSLSINYTASSYIGYNIFINQLSGYTAGKTDLIITVDPGVWLAGGLGVISNNPSDTVKIINRGFITGTGGKGGSWSGLTYTPPFAGTNAIVLSGSSVFVIDNTYGSAWIAGGGGGGAGSPYNLIGGGGGAGGGAGGDSFAQAYGGAGGIIGSAGNNGSYIYGYTGGGGGGRVLPGVGGSTGLGGGAGGGGGSLVAPSDGDFIYGSPGGSANLPGETSPNDGAGGGGGWGASGGSCSTLNGAAGGNAVYLSGASVTFINGDTSRVYGAVG
jgi:hypothetical protein